MSSIPDRDPLVRQIKETARAVAYRERLPWDLRALKEAGYWAARKARDEHRAAKERLGGVSFEGYAQRAIEEEMLATAKHLHVEAADGEKAPPSEDKIEEALKEFTAKEWRDLNPKETPKQWQKRMDLPASERFKEWIGLARSLSRSDVDAVLSYVYADAQTPEERKQRENELEQRFGTKKVNAFLHGIILRDTELWLEEHRAKLDPITDAYWAVVWEEEYSRANREGKGHPSKGHSLDEAKSDRNTAKSLKKRDEVIGRELTVSAYRVRNWRERARELPLEEFDGDLLSYLRTIYYTDEFKRYRDSKGKK